MIDDRRVQPGSRNVLELNGRRVDGVVDGVWPITYGANVSSPVEPSKNQFVIPMVLAAALFGPAAARADVITDWNIQANELLATSGMGTPPAVRTMAIVQTATYDAVNAITKRYKTTSKLKAAKGASMDAAVAAANRTVLLKLVPSKQTEIEAAYQAALDKIKDGPSKTTGIELGEQAAAAVLASRAEDGAATKETYRPHTAPGVYVPTAIPAVPQWGGRKPWLMKTAAQFRPAAPPALTSEVWARDFNESKSLGEKASTKRTPEQTAIATFWETTQPTIYHGIMRSVAAAPGRDVTQNARFFSVATQVLDDALIACLDAKYQFNLWRPITAIRNADNDGNDATDREPSWVPLIDTPMHPEYPCAHCIVSSALGGVIEAEIGKGKLPTLTTVSPSAKGAQRSWTKLGDFIQEVANARIFAGVHYRNSTEVGIAMGKKIGALAASQLPRK
jgi:hypothetical protein